MKALAAVLAGLLFASIAHAQEKQFPLPSKDWGEPVMDRPVFPFLLLDRIERHWQKGKDTRVWDVQGWVGGDYNKLWLKSEGEDVAGGRTEQLDIEALYARLISPFWYLQAGVRYEERPSPSRSALALGVQGLAPYWFDVEATAYLNEKGKASARFEAEYDFLLTQRLILQPRLETAFAASAEPERGVGRGFNNVELGLRLRYEIRRQFAPYIGVTWSRKLGDTADLARRTGDSATERAVVVGLRIWF
jgi:copper resistance protein B